jgi:acetyltransferase-like isoleucine patch superfamily enzyme
MSIKRSESSGHWTHGPLPDNVRLKTNTQIIGELAFKRFRSRKPNGLVIGAHSTMDGVHFDVGERGRVAIGDFCCFTSAILLCELEVTIGSFVAIGWNVTIADSDFHPLDPAQRIADAIACSPLGRGRSRPKVLRLPVVIEDDVWIGPNAAVLKGVRVGAGAWIEAGALVTRDVPRRARLMGNPAQIIGYVP